MRVIQKPRTSLPYHRTARITWSASFAAVSISSPGIVDNLRSNLRKATWGEKQIDERLKKHSHRRECAPKLRPRLRRAYAKLSYR
jgi:hypothetical protein